MVGAAPSFGVVHVVRTMFLLGDGPVGRKKLVKLLGLGEGSVRTIIKKLSQDGLLESRMQGHSLSRKGVRKLESMAKEFTRPIAFSSMDISEKQQSMVVVRNAADFVKSPGLDERDIAVRAGASGSVILVFDGGSVKFPSDDFSADKFVDLTAKLDSMKLKDGDVVVISFADSQNSAEDGALAVALELSRNRRA
ncbi:MAG: DUF4443 domain-containing protein [Candidatus Altiarchaeota archaeon]|nr:DUF4443 domain-containing protein [Candidatus Altiarchaeota archaeon]